MTIVIYTPEVKSTQVLIKIGTQKQYSNKFYNLSINKRKFKETYDSNQTGFEQTIHPIGKNSPRE